MVNEFPSQSAASEGFALCHSCGLVAAVDERHCPRCDASLHLRRRDSLQRTWALTLGALILYFPANMLPMLRVDSFYGTQQNTIVGGVVQFWRDADYPVAIIIFIASVVIPVLKLIAIVTLCLAARSGRWPVAMTRLYRMTEFIGRWS
ncbi:MAG: paraquat-inducible protein A, partial [Chthoniobacterales bacterium]